MPKPATIGSSTRYDGDCPAWTLRFDGEVVSRTAVEAPFAALSDLPEVKWRGSALDITFTDLAFGRGQSWKQFRIAVNAAIEQAHKVEPVLAVVFGYTDDMHRAPLPLLRTFLALRKRGAKRAKAVEEALRSDDPELRGLAMRFVSAVFDRPVLRELCARSQQDAELVQAAATAAITKWAWDYGTKTAPLNAALLVMDPVVLDAWGIYWISMAGVRNAPAIGEALAAAAHANPALFAEVVEGLEAVQPGGPASITLAFAYAECGEVDKARAHVAAALDELTRKEAKTDLWKHTIPTWLAALQERLG